MPAARRLKRMQRKVRAESKNEKAEVSQKLKVVTKTRSRKEGSRELHEH